ncbi:hypothetical protein [Polyangium sp. 15x6]|uniref:hypothetical protein n=1 Tax=Polyangium sp. 15x6 TaxID=3042687 RepID=UPI00249C98E2|nr:hypothetical protein [Polyangium sp. 15x6]MDI3286703.1 hypothetical protein [Polyangium sp. 15x6]
MSASTLPERLRAHLAAIRLDRKSPDAYTVSMENLAEQLGVSHGEMAAALFTLLPTGAVDALLNGSRWIWRDLVRAAPGLGELLAVLAHLKVAEDRLGKTAIWGFFRRGTDALKKAAYDGWNEELEAALRRFLPSLRASLDAEVVRGVESLEEPLRFGMRFSLVRHGLLPAPKWTKSEVKQIAEGLVEGGGWAPEQLEGIERVLPERPLAEALVAAALADIAKITPAQLRLFAPACSPEKLFSIASASFHLTEKPEVLDVLLELLPPAFVEGLERVAGKVPTRGEYLSVERKKERAAFALALLSRRASREGRSLEPRFPAAAEVAVQSMMFGEVVLGAMTPEDREAFFQRTPSVYRPYAEKYPSVASARWAVERILDHVDQSALLRATGIFGAREAAARLGEATTEIAKARLASALGIQPSPEEARALVEVWLKDKSPAWEQALVLQQGADVAEALRARVGKKKVSVRTLVERIGPDLVMSREIRTLAAELSEGARTESTLHAVAAASLRPDVVALDEPFQAAEEDVARVRDALEAVSAYRIPDTPDRSAQVPTLVDSDAPLVLRLLPEFRNKPRGPEVALVALARFPRDPALAFVVALLAPWSTDGIEDMAEILGERLVSPFLEIVRWEDATQRSTPERRAAILRALGGFPDERSLPVVLPHLAREDKDVAQAAREALASFLRKGVGRERITKELAVSLRKQPLAVLPLFASVPVPEALKALEALDRKLLRTAAAARAYEAALVLARGASMGEVVLPDPPLAMLDGPPLATLDAPANRLQALGGRVAASTGTDVHVWSVSTGEIERTVALAPHQEAVLVLGGEALVLAEEGPLDIVDLATGRRREGVIESYEHFAVVPDEGGEHLAMPRQSGQDTGIVFADVRKKKITQDVDLDGMPEACFPFPGGGFLISDAGSVAVWDAAKGKPRAVVWAASQDDECDDEDPRIGVPFARGTRVALVRAASVSIHGSEDGKKWKLLREHEGLPEGAMVVVGRESEVFAVTSPESTAVALYDGAGLPVGNIRLPEGFSVDRFVGTCLLATKARALALLDIGKKTWRAGVGLPADLSAFTVEPGGVVLAALVDGRIVRWKPS